MKTDEDAINESSLLNPIRVETGTSRYPIHRLAKKGHITIDIQEKDERGEVTLKWRVTYNSGFGQPGPLAYKLDTLIVNRRIEEAARPIPRIIRLGSLRDICRELGLNEGQATRNVKNALHQNASAYITAKTRYRSANGGERSIELGDTRYGVIFTGQSLPDGRTADAVYIVLHDRYREILDNAITRPLDYDYLKSLPPAPQRFYEILSYQMYAAIRHDKPRAKLIYSELCTHAPQTRHLDWEKVRSQMNKVHRPHCLSGYIGKKVDFHQTTDDAGRPDWIMHYQPGPKARAEYRSFTRRAASVTVEATEPAAEAMLPLLPAPAVGPLEQRLLDRGVSEKSAAELVERFPAAFIDAKLEEFDWEMTQPKPPKKPAGYLVKSIRDGYAADPDFVSTAQRQKIEADRQAREAQEAEARRQRQKQEAARMQALKAADDHLKGLTPAERGELEAAALAAASQDEQQNYRKPAMKPFRQTMMLLMLRQYLQPSLREETPLADA